jgi:hypothetical protein
MRRCCNAAWLLLLRVKRFRSTGDEYLVLHKLCISRPKYGKVVDTCSCRLPVHVLGDMTEQKHPSLLCLICANHHLYLPFSRCFP